MNKRQKAAIIIERLKMLYPNPECGLSHRGDSFRLLIMAILSAQCTDARVNEVSLALFERFPSAESMVASKKGEIENIIYPLGFYNAKAEHLRRTSEVLINEFGGVIPSDMDDLLRLSGVGRKVANLIRGDVFGLGGIVADTHCIRISVRLGLCDKPNPVSVEKALCALIPKNKQSDFCHGIVLFGRAVCRARGPDCGVCVMNDICTYMQQMK